MTTLNVLQINLAILFCVSMYSDQDTGSLHLEYSSNEVHKKPDSSLCTTSECNCVFERIIQTQVSKG